MTQKNKESSELVRTLNLRIKNLEYVLNAFHIDPEKTLSMIESNGHVQLYPSGCNAAS